MDAVDARRRLLRIDEVRARVLVGAHRDEASVHQLDHLPVHEVGDTVEALVLEEYSAASREEYVRKAGAVQADD